MSTTEETTPLTGDNNDNGAPEPEPPNDVAPQVLITDDDLKLSEQSEPNFLSVLEVANNLRKDDIRFTEGMAQAKEDVEHVLRQNNLNNTNINGQHHSHGNTNNGASTPTLEDLADSDGEVESVFESKDEDDDDDYYYQEDNGGRPAYTAETVAAISSLMKGEESDAGITSGNGRSGGGGSGSGSGSSKQREISLQDRAAALVTVYRDFVQEEDDMNYEQEGGEGDVDENENAPPPKNPFLDSNNQNQGPQHGKQVQVASTSTNSHDFRREEIKVATLEKFCKDVNVHDSTAAAAASSDDDNESSSSSDDESSFSVSPSTNRYNNPSSIGATIQEAEQGLLSFMMEEDNNNMDISCGGRLTKGVQPYTPPPPKSQLPKPTAATTTAAFRLKAEVALKVRAVGSKTKIVAKKAVAKVAAGVTTANKNRKAQKKEGSSKVMPATIDNDFDFQDYEQRLYTEDGEDDHEVGECYDPDDLEYGLSPSKVEGGLHRRTPSGQQQQMQTNGHTNDGNGDEDGDSTVYGMHILDRDQSLKCQISDENEDVGLFNELCDELGVTSDTHPGLLQHGNLKYFYRHPRTSRYRYPVFRSNKCKQALYYFVALLLLLAIGVSIISAVSNGFEEVRHRKAPPLPDWKSDEEWRERQKVDWEQSHPGDYVVGKEGWEKPDDAVVEGGGETTSEEEGSSNVEEFASISGQQQQSSDNDMGKLFQKISAAYRPVWYDRETGWVGQTYSEALSWCSSHDGYIPCPYEVYCPNESTLLAGVMDNNGESWAPVINADNAWVQVGTGTPCELYSDKYGDHPVWGSNGLNNEAITRHIMCCREHPANVGDSGSQVQNKGEHGVVEKATGPPSGAASKKPQEETEQLSVISTSKEHKEEVDLQMLFLAMNKKYNPRGFNRNSAPSWKGQTYQEALDFCAHMQEYIPCPYEVYCPGGHGKLLEGIQDPGESWSPIIDGANDWVQVGVNGECNLWSETFKEPPEWGMTGENNEELTRHIMCCHSVPHIETIMNGGAAEDDSTPETNKDNVVDVTGPSLVTLPELEEPQPTHSLTDLEVKIMDAHHPVWFSNQVGWQGTTHAHAKEFCESIPHSEGGKTLHLCPLEAHCPNGPRETEPLYLQQDAFEGIQWAPISNQDNGWVMVGKFKDDNPLTCQTYLDINHHEPEWDDGSSSELKKHILCCEDNVGNDGGTLKGEEENSLVEEAEQPSGDLAKDEEGSSNVGSSPMTELEIKIQDKHHPTWYSTEFGWNGASYDDAKAFCESIPHGDDGDTLHLCPLHAYCPNGARETEPLYLQQDAFEGVQWAPYSNEYNGWIMAGDVNSLTCQTYMQINHRDPSWGLDGSSPNLKEHIMCCEGNTDDITSGVKVDNIGSPLATADGSEGGGENDKLTDMIVGIQQGSGGSSGQEQESNVLDAPKQEDNQGFEASISSTFNPIWFDEDQGGWDGGSHTDGIKFCEQFNGSHGKPMELCPYAAYCPKGPSEQVIGGHQADFEVEGEQWAPVFGQENHWVMIGKRGNNHSTTCLSHVQLSGNEPSWGLDDSNKQVKKHILCCSPFQ